MLNNIQFLILSNEHIWNSLDGETLVEFIRAVGVRRQKQLGTTVLGVLSCWRRLI